MNKPRVLILNYEYPPLGGGAANATYYLIKELGLRPDEVSATLITSSVNEERYERISENIDIHFLDIGKKGNIHYQSQKDLLTYSYKAFFKARKLHSVKPFDIVHAFFGIPCGFVAMRLKIPYIVSLRGSDVPFYNERFYWQDKIIFQRLSRRIWKQSKGVVCNSQGLKDLASQTNPSQPISIIPNGIDLQDFQSKADIQTRGKLKLISTGRLIPRKGYDILIDALKGIDEVSLTIIGDGPEKDNLQRLAIENGVELNLLGALKHDQIPTILSKYHVFALPSYNEGMSNAALEAMAVGLPLLLTDVGGSRELISNNGYMVAPGDSNALRSKILHVLENRGDLTMMSKASIEHSKLFSWSSMAVSYLQLYKA